METAVRKRKRGRGDNTADAARHICEDILVDILSRLPARSAIRCAELSKRHQKLIATSKFWDSRCRLAGAPLPPPHVAYLATVWPDDRTRHRGSVEVFPRTHSAFHDFRLAGEGLRRWIFQDAGVTGRYVGTCNGIVLLAAKDILRVVLFNPAVAHSEREVFFPCPERKTGSSRYRISGIGYGPSTGVYKLVVTRQEKLADFLKWGKLFYTTELLVCTLGTAGERPRKVSSGLRARIRGASLYMDGKVYLLDVKTSAVLVLDVDGETVSSITLPGARVLGAAAAAVSHSHAMSGLMEVAGRVCVATADGSSRTAVWLLITPEHRWERRFVCYGTLPRLAGAWDCGGGALLLLSTRGNGTVIFLCDGSNDTVLECAVPSALRLDKPDYALCWGYRPTLVSTRSVIGARSRVRQCRGFGGLYAVVEPVIELHKERARERTAHVNSVMDLLLHIIGTRPQEREDVIKQLGLQMSNRLTSLLG